MRISAGELRVPAAFALAALACGGVRAQEPGFEIGARGRVIIGDGEPANDMIGYGVVGRWEFRESWRLGAALDSVTFDYETPYRVLGIESIEEIDTSNELTRISVFVERRYQRLDSPWAWFWSAGAGFASIDVGANVTGTTPDGASFEIATTADDEAHVFVGAGLRRSFSEHWAVEAALTLEHHATDYRVVDVVSGAAGTIDAQTPYGLALGISYDF